MTDETAHPPSNDRSTAVPTAEEYALLREAYAETYPVRSLLNAIDAKDAEIERLREELDTHLKVHLGVVRENVRLRAIAEERDELVLEVARLQHALAFWLPKVPASDAPAAIRCGDDAMLLAGCECQLEPCAEELGLITFRPGVRDDACLQLCRFARSA